MCDVVCLGGISLSLLYFFDRFYIVLGGGVILFSSGYLSFGGVFCRVAVCSGGFYGIFLGLYLLATFLVLMLGCFWFFDWVFPMGFSPLRFPFFYFPFYWGWVGD